MADKIENEIYEAGAMAELWPQVISRISDLVGTHGGVLFSVRPTAGRWIASESLAGSVQDYYTGGYHLRSNRLRRLVEREHAGFSADFDLFTPQEWEDDPVRREFLMPRGYGWGVATNIEVPPGETMVFHFEKRLQDGPVDHSAVAFLDKLRPHLSRAALLSSRLDLQNASGTVAGLEAIGLPAAVIDRAGRLRTANAPFNALIPKAFCDRQSGLEIADERTNLLFQDAIRAAKDGPLQLPLSLALPSQPGRPPMIIHVSPIRGAAHDVFVHSTAVIVVTPVYNLGLPSATVIQALFDLTPAEARVARAIAQGDTVGQIAAAYAVADNTVRNQLRSIFAKTGVSRQAELVALLAGFPVLHEPEGN